MITNPKISPENKSIHEKSKMKQEIKRFKVIRKNIRGMLTTDSGISKNGLVILVEDNAGIAKALSEQLSDLGYKTVILGLVKTEEIQKRFEEAIEDAKAPLVGFINISNLNNIDFDEISEIETAKQALLYAKYFYLFSGNKDYNQRFFLNVVRMDGKLGTDGTTKNIIQGSLFGLCKSLKKEWKDICVRIIDIASDCSTKNAVNYILQELMSGDSEYVEIGRSRDGDRVTLSLVETYEKKVTDRKPVKDDVFVVTGGGRGVTAKCIIKLAQLYKCKFALLGKTTLIKDVNLLKMKNKEQLRKELIEQMNEEGCKVHPIEVDRRLKAIINTVEILQTISEIQQAGGQAIYYSCDVTNFQELDEKISTISNEQGKVTGVIHGAGVLRDKKVQRKNVEDFDYVFGTKYFGLQNILKIVSSEQLKYIVLFSSIAAFAGSDGQTDYAMANEYFNKFAYQYKNQHKNSIIISINWGAWDGGMINPIHKEKMESLGVRIIPIETGIDYFVDEFSYEHDNKTCQIVIC